MVSDHIRNGDHIGLILAARITSPHFRVSSATSLPKSAGEPAMAMPPSLASRAFASALARPSLIALFNMLTISAGVPFGAARPYHWLASIPGTSSPSVGRFGSAADRTALVTARPFSLPARMYPIAAGML